MNKREEVLRRRRVQALTEATDDGRVEGSETEADRSGNWLAATAATGDKMHMVVPLKLAMILLLVIVEVYFTSARVAAYIMLVPAIGYLALHTGLVMVGYAKRPRKRHAI